MQGGLEMAVQDIEQAIRETPEEEKNCNYILVSGYLAGSESSRFVVSRVRQAATGLTI